MEGSWLAGKVAGMGLLRRIRRTGCSGLESSPMENPNPPAAYDPSAKQKAQAKTSRIPIKVCRPRC